MSDKYTKLAVVVPTRNRSNLAINAIESILSQKNCEFDLIVSDNSTDEAEVSKLKSHCDSLNNERLDYIHPPEPLSMPDHWEWIRKEVSQMKSISHILFLTDRMVFRENCLQKLIQVLQEFPGRVVSYPMNTLHDNKTPVILSQKPYSEKKILVDSLKVAEASSELIFPESIPRMLNCVVPTTVFDKIEKRFDKVFDSVSPDFCLAYKIIDTEENYIFFDIPLVLSYGTAESNGRSLFSGKESKDSRNFVSVLQNNNQSLNQLTPSPQLVTLSNAIAAEYLYVKKVSPECQFPELNLYSYFRVNELDINSYIENQDIKRKLLEICKNERRRFRYKISLFDMFLCYKKRFTVRKAFSKFYLLLAGKFSGKEKFPNIKLTKWNSRKDAIRAFQATTEGKSDKSWLYLAAISTDIGFSETLKIKTVE